MITRRSQIDELIAATDDQRQRDILLVLAMLDAEMQSEHRLLAEQRDTFKTYRDKVDEHQRIIEGGRWAWWAVTGMGAIILMLSAYVLTTKLQAINEDAMQGRINTVRLTLLEYQVTEIRRELGLNKKSDK